MSGNDDTSAISLDLGGSIGRDGRNDPVDVLRVKARLAALGFDWLDPEGGMDDETVRTIRLFQSIKDGAQRIGGDGRIDRGGATQGWLEAANAPHWQRMPAGRPEDGFHNTEVVDQPDDLHDFGTDWMAETIRAAATAYKQAHLARRRGAALLTVNDVSLPRGGRTPDHAGHQTGLSCDLRLPRADGSAPPGTRVGDSHYDRAALRAMLTALHGQPLLARVFLNDPVLVAEDLCFETRGHDDHAHVEIAAPERRP